MALIASPLSGCENFIVASDILPKNRHVGSLQEARFVKFDSDSIVQRPCLLKKMKAFGVNSSTSNVSLVVLESPRKETLGESLERKLEEYRRRMVEDSNIYPNVLSEDGLLLPIHVNYNLFHLSNGTPMSFCSTSTECSERDVLSLTSDFETAKLEQQRMKVYVRSGQSSARQRRLKARNERIAKAEMSTKHIDVQKLNLKEPEVETTRRRKPETANDFIAKYLAELGKVKLLNKDEEISLSTKFRQAKKILSVKERLELELGSEIQMSEVAKQMDLPTSSVLRAVHEGIDARDKLVMANLRLVVSVAKKYNKSGVQLPDLIQAGTLGLRRGIETFDPTRGYKLSTYTHWWIRQAVNRCVADHSRTIRLPVHIHETLARVRGAKEFLHSTGKALSVENIAEYLDLPVKKIQKAFKAEVQMRSMDTNLRPRDSLEEGSSMHQFIADTKSATPWENADAQYLREAVQRLLSDALDPRERAIVKAHFGIGHSACTPMSLESISRRHGISRERTRQLETVALRRLKITGLERELNLYKS